MRKHIHLLGLALVVSLAGCAPTSDSAAPASDAKPAASVEPSSSPSESFNSFPTEAFTDISEKPVSDKAASRFQSILEDMAGEAGMSATVLSPPGTWTGVTGRADGVRDMHPEAQFAIGSVTKSVIAAQVLLLAEAGELELDAPATDYLPSDLDYETNGATIRQLAGMHSGIPDYWDAIRDDLAKDRLHTWTVDEMLTVADTEPGPLGAFRYSNTNFVLLGMVIEQVGGASVRDVLREGVLDIEGTDRFIYQPDEKPSDPMALPNGEPRAKWRKGGGYLPSLASATAGPETGAMASDSLSLARWWHALCSGRIISQGSLDQMSTLKNGYGLGMYSPYPGVLGHTGEDIGYAAWAGCLPKEGSVIVVLANTEIDDMGEIGGPLVEAVSD